MFTVSAQCMSLELHFLLYHGMGTWRNIFDTFGTAVANVFKQANKTAFAAINYQRRINLTFESTRN